MDPKEIAARIDAMHEGTFAGELGLVMVSASRDEVRAKLTVTSKHHQPYGIVHGGAWASIVESVASHGAARAVMGTEGIAGVVGTSNLTDFLRSHSEGRVDAVGRPVFVGRNQQLWTVEITRASDGKLVSRGQVRFQNLQQLPAERG